MARKFGKDGLVVLAINQWDEDRDTLLRFVAEKKLEHRILLEGGAVGRDLYGVSGVPSNFWINREGVIVATNGDSTDPSLLERKTQKLVAGK